MDRTLIRFSLAILAILALTIVTTPLDASAQTADGYGSRVHGVPGVAPDDDGDGIPNGLDPDYTPPLDGTGRQFGPGEGLNTCDGSATGAVNRFLYKWRYMWMRIISGGAATANGLGWGPGDGTGNDGDGPADGTGYGPGQTKLCYKPRCIE